jgi:hypothetical protein
MAEKQPPVQCTPRFRTDIYPFILPSKFRGSLQDKVAIITGKSRLLSRVQPPITMCSD